MEELIRKWYLHGVEVNYWYNKLCKDPSIIGIDKVEEFFRNYTPKDLSQYHINHDISKPYIQEVDEQGRVHYPNHSSRSSEMYIDRFGHDVYADMIKHDMDFHRVKGDGIREVWDLPFSDDLYATAWAEIHANAELFGGFDSDSFKIKRKKLVRALSKR